MVGFPVSGEELKERPSFSYHFVAARNLVELKR
jgi:hypothetical protein